MLNLISFLLNVTFERRKIFAITELKEGENGEYVARTKDFHNGGAANPVYSTSKCVSALGLGLLYDRGLVKPEDKVCDFLGEYIPEDADEKWKIITINDVLHHKIGGVDHWDLDFDGRMNDMPEELLTPIFSQKLPKRVGVDHSYSDTNYYIICRIIEKIVGEPAGSFINTEIFSKMNFVMNAWSADKYNHTFGGTGLYLRLEDYAKLGWLMLNKGVWKGERIVSEEWINKMIATEAAGVSNYGYGIRNIDGNTYNFSGARGQCAVFDYDLRRVFAWQSRKGGIALNIVGALIYLKKHIFKSK